ncbi:Protein kinase domain-containing protein [Heracleum sosnowskyi]|uniref:Protein kinase domain-containing protein n=1 Tax=Heracleum sosnowskyi TaxID=360622 RepID=A0AAD8IEK2_9APIA|nr:Protein kinase domain-containing protein [Heracleum sosnowskyi]
MRSGAKEDKDDDGGGLGSLFFELRTLQIATNFFSELNMLGHGGFGPVYKGLMPDGQEVAVKKLSLESRQGLREFTNEVKLLLKVQHKNLVMLLGCCVEGPEKMLVYEYLQNKSLDYILFDKRKSASLDWAHRFQIITGVVRGLLYLHEEAPGMTHILIHLGSLVPMDIWPLKIVSGRKNFDRLLGSEKTDLLSYAWELFQARKTLELVDASLVECNPDEAAMCIQLGLLCCQASFSERPDMNTIYLMLSSGSFILPKPGLPAIQGRGGHWTTTTSAMTNTNGSSIQTEIAKASAGSSFVEDYSRNSISYSSMDEGR